MQVPVPPRSDQPPAVPSYASLPKRNSAAITSLVCAILWPLILVAVLLWNSSRCTTTGAMTTCIGTATPAWFSTLTGVFLLILPPAGIITAVLGLVRSFNRPHIHGRWLAVIGLIFGLLWLVAAEFL
jgi:hypothetical protein